MASAILLFALITTRVPLPHGFRPTAIATADFNGDGHPDVAVAGLGAQVMVLLGDGRGGLRAMPPVAAGASPSSITATTAFIAVANHETDYVTLLAGDGKGHFTPRTLHLHSRPHPHAVAIGDFDRDGRPDLAVDSWGENRIMLLFGRDGWRGPGTPVDMGTNPYWTISTADAARFAVREIAAAVVLVPLAMAALLLFAIPYRLTGYAARWFTQEPDVAASHGLLRGS